jgi:hypothetical protein
LACSMPVAANKLLQWMLRTTELDVDQAPLRST